MATKTQALQTQIDSLQRQLDAAKSNADYHAKLRQADSKFHSEALTQAYNKVNTLKAEHDQKLREVSRMASDSITRTQDLNRIEVLKAERNAIGEAFKYLTDSITRNKE